MKTWKMITIAFAALAAVSLTAVSVYAFCLGIGAQGTYNSYAGTANTYFGPNGIATAAPSTPVTQTNTQTPTLYTPSGIQTVSPGYPYNGMGRGCPGRWGYGAQGYPNTATTAPPLTMDQATQIATIYVTSLRNTDLKVTQVEEYTANFYVQVNEKSTGYGAFQLLVNKYTGVVTPEPGPNMMWNTEYTFGAGYCNWLRSTTTAQPTVTVDQAKANAQQYLTSFLPGTTVGEATTFHGYYTLEVVSNGTPYGMLSVNSYTGQVWYHTWHGTFIQENNTA